MKKLWVFLALAGTCFMMWGEFSADIQMINYAVGILMLIVALVNLWRISNASWKFGFGWEVFVVLMCYLTARAFARFGPPMVSTFLFWHVANFFAALSTVHFVAAVICHWADSNVFQSREYKISKNFVLGTLVLAMLIFYFSYALMGGPVSFYHELALRLRPLRLWIFVLPFVAHFFRIWSNKRIPAKMTWPSAESGKKNIML